MDLRFITKSGRYLSLLASKTTQLQNLLRYIGQVQRQIELEWKNAQELPARFLRSVNEELQEKCQCDFITAIYHLVVTGHCFEPMKEFLADIVGERVCEPGNLRDGVLMKEIGPQEMGQGCLGWLREYPATDTRMSPPGLGTQSSASQPISWIV
jgi:hypothetical protein